MNYLFYGIELGVALLFLLILYYTIQKKRNIEILVMSVIYAFIFDNFNILLLAGKSGGYTYNPEFFLLIGVPIFAILSFAIILFSSFEISDTLPIPNKIKFLADGLFVFLMYLSIGLVAIRLRLWTWNGYAFNEGFFGVPAGSYLGILLLTLIFSFFYRKFKNREKPIVYSIPLISYLIFLIVGGILYGLQSLIGISKSLQLILVLIALIAIIFIIVKNISPFPKKAARLSLWIRLPLHLFSIIILMTTRFDYNIYLLMIVVILMIGEFFVLAIETT